MNAPSLSLFDTPAKAKPLWLTTLADLALLLLGFFVFLHASNALDKAAIANSIRAAFGAQTPIAPQPELPTDMARVTGFAPGKAIADRQALGAIADWAARAAQDPRTTLRLTGSVDGSVSDRDAATGSGTILGYDRARSVAVALIDAHAIAADRIAIAPPAGGERAVRLTIEYAGTRQAVADRAANAVAR